MEDPPSLLLLIGVALQVISMAYSQYRALFVIGRLRYPVGQSWIAQLYYGVRAVLISLWAVLVGALAAAGLTIGLLLAFEPAQLGLGDPAKDGFGFVVACLVATWLAAIMMIRILGLRIGYHVATQEPFPLDGTLGRQLAYIGCLIIGPLLLGLAAPAVVFGWPSLQG